ncbi:hypothetical protein [Glycomyces tenuis]|uniref:hypothetical protein n=1 Tax=Glycomyces tenuis TaxID=58116 RepID=UPI0012DE2AF9|nr:hypothetical protein [Glycomyces tenuis]
MRAHSSRDSRDGDGDERFDDVAFESAYAQDRHTLERELARVFERIRHELRERGVDPPERR